MNGLNFSIPQRLFFIRATVTLGLIISFFLSLNLWGGQRYFPSRPVFEEFLIAPPYDFVLMGISVLFLICSLIFTRTRTFIFLAILANIFLVLFDMNRMQPWFYIYNAVLFLMLFYNGRIDNPEKFTTIFILLQLVFCSVYIFNGINQLNNPMFLETDYFETILPLNKIFSERQFSFFMKAGNIVPWFFLLSGISFLLVAVRYLAVSFAIIVHTALLFLMFPVFNGNPALWLMNLVFCICILFLFSGNTKQRYFSPLIVFKKPLFYAVFSVFYVLPVINTSYDLPPTLAFNFKCGKSGQERKHISETDYKQLPFYSRAFCSRVQNGYIIDLSSWCSHELKSEYLLPVLSKQTSVANSDDESDSVRELSFFRTEAE